MSVLVTWNVAGRVRSVEAQAAAITAANPDIIVLQEVRAVVSRRWCELLADRGYRFALATLEGATAREPERRLGVLTAAREPLERLPPPDLPWPERLLMTRARVAETDVVLYNLHVPTSARSDLIKVRTIEALTAELEEDDRSSAVLAGDLNTPQYESREGEVSSFARTRSGAIRPAFGERHDRAEMSLVPGLAAFGFEDAFRSCNGYLARDRSWLYPNKKMGYRLDHIFVRGLEATECAYDHTVREQGLSDHSALWAKLRARRLARGPRWRAVAPRAARRQTRLPTP